MKINIKVERFQESGVKLTVQTSFSEREFVISGETLDTQIMPTWIEQYFDMVDKPTRPDGLNLSGSLSHGETH